MNDWEYIDNEEMIWARNVDTDPYGKTHEVIFNLVHDTIDVRMASNERADHFVTQVGVDVEVIAETMRKAGWTVTPPKEKRDL
jgi:hypothetical protein